LARRSRRIYVPSGILGWTIGRPQISPEKDSDIMFKTILVPLDGSPLAAKALPYAKFLARKAGGHLALVRAVDSRAQEKELGLRPEAEADLSAVAADVRAQGLEVESHVYMGEAAKAIELAADSVAADIIVMSTHGRSGLARWAYGSVAERVLRLGTWPVVLIPAHYEQALDLERPGTIVVPLDGSDLAEQALEPAAELAHLIGGGSLTLLQVIEPPNVAYAGAELNGFYPIMDNDAWIEGAKPYLDGVAHRPVAAGLSVSAETLIGYPAATIADLAARKNAAAIVMASHGRTGFARAVLGSVAAGVVQRATVPTLIVRPASLGATPAAKPAGEPSS
jgi:nucleotide-binding universal stress UspA family protein